MKGPCADGLLKIDCHLCRYALSEDELRRHAEPVILGGVRLGRGGSGWEGGEVARTRSAPSARHKSAPAKANSVGARRAVSFLRH